MTLSEEQLAALLMTSNCSVAGTLPEPKASVPKPGKDLNKTETFFKQLNLLPMLHDKTALVILEQPEPILLQAAPKVTYKPDFLIVTRDLQIWCYEVKAARGAWTGEREDDSLKMRFLKGKFPYVRMFLALVNVQAREVRQQEITLTGRTRKVNT